MARPSARDRLLDCAERLFADHGVAGVSLRAINAEAGLSPAALHYHFGTKNALLEALLDRRMPALMERRSELLDAVEKGPGPPTSREVMDALIRPLAELLAREGEGGRRYLRMLCRLQADGDIDAQFVVSRYRHGVERLEPMLQRALPDHPVGVVRIRLVLAIDLMLRALADGEQLARDIGAVPDSAAEYVAHIVDFLVGGLEAPTQVTPGRSTLDARASAAIPHGEET